MPDHTPGPWRHERTLGGGYEVWPGCGLAPVAKAYRRHEVEANARLIAAAPTLYLACKAALDRLDYLQQLWGAEGVTTGLADMLRSAVARAEGGHDA